MATVISPRAAEVPEAAESYEYLSGFGNEHESEALAGALPQGRFSPQKVAYGLYAEKLSSTAFTAPRESNRRTWFYRIRPSVTHGDFRPLEQSRIFNGPIADVPTPPNQMRWDPIPIPDTPADFVDGLVTFAANGNAATQTGCGIHYYLANRSMADRYFYDADGELLIVPQQGRLDIHTECGRLDVTPGEVALIPRGMKFSVALPDGPSRGYVCENYGAHFRLPERGPVGSDGFANDRDFKAPVAAYEDKQGEFEMVCKFAGGLHACAIDHSPLDVVAWVGNSLPYKYNLELFNVMGTVSYDHPDPSIYTVLTSPSDTYGTANVDFVIFPPRWMVGEDTFRAPWYHRNVMSEFMGLIYGVYDAKPEGFVPGGASLHNSMAAHGPDEAAFDGSSNTKLAPVKQTDTMAFMFESRYVIQPTRFALESAQRQQNYVDCWQKLGRHFKQ